MILEVTDTRYLRDYVIWVRFNDGSAGEVDLANELDGPVFGPLRDKRLFRAVRVDPLLRTVAWPNEADLAPEFLAERLTQTGRHGRSGTCHSAIVVRSDYPAAERKAVSVREESPRYGARKKATKKSKATRTTPSLSSRPKVR